MTIPHDEYYEITIELIQEWIESETELERERILVQITDGEDLLVIERLVQLAIKGMEDE